MQSVIGLTSEWAFQTVAAEKASNTTIVTYVSASRIATKPMVIFGGLKGEDRLA